VEPSLESSTRGWGHGRGEYLPSVCIPVTAINKRKNERRKGKDKGRQFDDVCTCDPSPQEAEAEDLKLEASLSYRGRHHLTRHIKVIFFNLPLSHRTFEAGPHCELTEIHLLASASSVLGLRPPCHHFGLHFFSVGLVCWLTRTHMRTCTCTHTHTHTHTYAQCPPLLHTSTKATLPTLYPADTGDMSYEPADQANTEKMKSEVVTWWP